MAPHSHDEQDHYAPGHDAVDAAELKEYIEHNIKHLEEHVKIFTKLQSKIEDQHALESLRSAIDFLQQGVLELKNILNHLDE